MGGDGTANQQLVDGRGWTLQGILTNRTFKLGYFQREYVWSRLEVRQLVDDLAKCFLSEWRSAHSIEKALSYPSYFLGPIVTYLHNGNYYLADGQQRFTTLTLMLIHLRRMARDQGLDNTARVLDHMISKPQIVGSPVFAIDEALYRQAFDNIYQGQSSHDGDDHRVVRLHDAYAEIVSAFSADPFDEALQHFVHWLCHRVSLVEIDAVDRNQAWIIYQSMNDRGMHLKPIDYLKGYLIDNDSSRRAEALSQWDRMSGRLERIKEGTTFEYIKAIFRSHFSDIASLPGAPDRDTATHEWVRRHEKLIWPQNTVEGRVAFTISVLTRLSTMYVKFLKATKTYDARLPALYFNSVHGLHTQMDMMIACCRPNESDGAREAKARIVADFVDRLFVLHGVNNEVFTDLELQQISGRLLSQLAKCSSIVDVQNALAPELEAISLSLSDAAHLRLRNDNRSFVHYLLARLTAWLDLGTQRGDFIARYLARQGNVPDFEIEHMYPARPTVPQNMPPTDYALGRSRIGALLLLDGSANAGLGGDALEKKIEFYRGPLGNLLAASLHPESYKHGAAKFKRFIRSEELHKMFVPLAPGHDMNALIEQRCLLYQAMIERIWDPVRLKISPSPIVASAKGARGKKRSYGVDFDDLVQARYIAPGARLIGRLDPNFSAIVLPDGRIQTPSGSTFTAPSPAAIDVLERSCNGWTFWHVASTEERIDAIRSHYLRDRAK